MLDTIADKAVTDPSQFVGVVRLPTPASQSGCLVLEERNDAAVTDPSRFVTLGEPQPEVPDS
jgi:hypothetical protein